MTRAATLGTLATVVGFLLVGACAATEAGVIATFGEGDPRSGVVLAIWAVASLTGGLLLGRLPIGPWALAWRLAIVLLGSSLALVAWEFWSLNAALLIAGACIAPALAVIDPAARPAVAESVQLGAGERVGRCVSPQQRVDVVARSHATVYARHSRECCALVAFVSRRGRVASRDAPIDRSLE